MFNRFITKPHLMLIALIFKHKRIISSSSPRIVNVAHTAYTDSTTVVTCILPLVVVMVADSDCILVVMNSSCVLVVVADNNSDSDCTLVVADSDCIVVVGVVADTDVDCAGRVDEIMMQSNVIVICSK